MCASDKRRFERKTYSWQSTDEHAHKRKKDGEDEHAELLQKLVLLTKWR